MRMRSMADMIELEDLKKENAALKEVIEALEDEVIRLITSMRVVKEPPVGFEEEDLFKYRS